MLKLLVALIHHYLVIYISGIQFGEQRATFLVSKHSSPTMHDDRCLVFAWKSPSLASQVSSYDLFPRMKLNLLEINSSALRKNVQGVGIPLGYKMGNVARLGWTP